jgi:hypothetical protein
MITQTTQVKWCAECGTNYVVEVDDQTLCKLCQAKPATKLELAAPRVDPVVLKPIAWHDVPLKARRVGPAREVKHCAICTKDFEPRGNRQRYCDNCAQDVRRTAKREHAKLMRAAAPKPAPAAKPERKRQVEFVLTDAAKQIVAAKQATPPAQQWGPPAVSAHWHFRVNENGGPTCYFPSRNAPSAPHVVRPAIAGEKQDQAWDRYCEVDDEGRNLRWRHGK